MGMVSGQEETPGHITPPREPEHDCRQALQVGGGQARLDLEQ